MSTLQVMVASRFFLCTSTIFGSILCMQIPFLDFFLCINGDNQLTWLHYISKAIENLVPGVKSFSEVSRYEIG